MDIQLREGVFDRTCNYVQMNCAVMGLVIKELERIGLDSLNESVEAMKKSLKETNQDWAIRETKANLMKCVRQSQTALKEN